MLGTLAKRSLRRAHDFIDRVHWRLSKNRYESVFFYTFHKCASMLFAGYLLKNVTGLKHMDYASLIYNGCTPRQLEFDRTGFVYGPIRLSGGPPDLLDVCAQREFIRQRIAVFLIRDPRDLLVSGYYSFGYSHGLSPVPALREKMQRQQMEIQSKSIDDYALDTVDTVRLSFERLHMLSESSERHAILKYEDMVLEWDHFVRGLTEYLSIRPAILSELFERSRPREKIELNAHKRSGQVGQFRHELQPGTVRDLNRILQTILLRYQYSE